jgi:hypothetical protein
VQVSAADVSINAELEIDAASYKIPHIKSLLEITAPETWIYFTNFQNKSHGSIEYNEAVTALLLAVGLEPFPEIKNATIVGPIRTDAGAAKLVIRLSDTFDTFDKSISTLPTFRISLENFTPIIAFTPESIKPAIPIVAELQLHGMDADHAGYTTIGTAVSPSSTEMMVRWKLPAESYHQGDQIEVPFLFSTLQQLIQETYHIPTDQSVKINTHATVEKSGTLIGIAIIRTRLEISAPREWPFVDGLRPDSHQQPVDRERFNVFLRTLKAWESHELENFVSGPLLWSNFSVADNWVHVTLSSRSIGFNPFMPHGRGREGLVGGIYWEGTGSKTKLFFNSGSSQAYPWLIETAEAEIKGFDVLSATPIPKTDDGAGKMTWEIPTTVSLSSTSGIVLELNTEATTLIGRVFAKLLDPYSIISTINFILSLVFIFFLFRILSSRRASPHYYFPPDALRLVQILYPLVIVLVILQLLFGSRFLYYSLFSGWLNLSPEQMAQAGKITFSLDQIYGFYSILALVIFTLTAAWQTRHSKTVKQPALWLSGIFFGTLLAFPYGYSLINLISSNNFTGMQHDLLNYARDVLDSEVYEKIPFPQILFFTYAFVIFGFTIFILTGLGQLFVAMMSGISLKQVATRFGLTGRRVNWIIIFLALAICAQWGYVRVHQMSANDWMYQDVIDSVIKDYASNLTSQVFSMLPLFILVGIAVILYHAGMSERSPLISAKLRWCIALVALAFGRFVSNTSLSFAGFSFPLGLIITFWILPLLLDTKLDRAQAWIERNYPHDTEEKERPLSVHRKEFLERAKAMEDLEAQNQSVYSEYTKNLLDLDTYHARQNAIKDQLEWITRGGASKFRSRKDHFQKIKAKFLSPLPGFVSPKDLALSLGPKQDWWQNGVLAASFGLVLAILPVGYHLYVLLVSRAKIILSSGDFGVTFIFNDILFEIAFWLVAAFTMGMLYPYLRGRNGVMKGAYLAAIYGFTMAITALLQSWIDQDAKMSWLFSTLQLLLFWVALGVIMDWSTLRTHNLYWREMVDLYNLQDTRVLVGYLSPLTLSLLGVAQQIISGAASNSIIAEVVKSLSTALPNLP